MSEHIFINFSNHPSDRWSNEQKKAALNYGEIIDIPFPSVDSNGDESYIKETGNKMIERIMSYHPKAVLCQGEFTLAYYIISALMRNGIIVLAACSNRNVKEDGNKKIVEFNFVRFRSYIA